MSRADVEQVRRMLEHFTRTNEPLLDVLDERSVWDMSNYTGWPEDQTYSGPEGIARFLRTWLDAFDDYELALDDLIDAGDCVVAVMRQSGTAKGSSARFEMRFGQVYRLREGMLDRVLAYDDPDEALRAAGLGETAA